MPTDSKRPPTATSTEARYRALVPASADVVYQMNADWTVMEALDGRSLVASNGTPIVGSRRVLIVDDSRDGADSLGMMLGLAGHEIALAYDGIEAIERAEQFRPDVILIDVGMPRLNGLDATRRIRQEPWGQAATIIALTDWATSAIASNPARRVATVTW